MKRLSQFSEKELKQFLAKYKKQSSGTDKEKSQKARHYVIAIKQELIARRTRDEKNSFIPKSDEEDEITIKSDGEAAPEKVQENTIFNTKEESKQEDKNDKLKEENIREKADEVREEISEKAPPPSEVNLSHLQKILDKKSKMPDGINRSGRFPIIKKSDKSPFPQKKNLANFKRPKRRP